MARCLIVPPKVCFCLTGLSCSVVGWSGCLVLTLSVFHTEISFECWEVFRLYSLRGRLFNEQRQTCDLGLWKWNIVPVAKFFITIKLNDKVCANRLAVRMHGAWLKVLLRVQSQWVHRNLLLHLLLLILFSCNRGMGLLHLLRCLVYTTFTILGIYQ